VTQSTNKPQGEIMKVFGFNLKELIILMLSILMLVNFTFSQAAEANDKQKAVLVTGASSGIGKKITEVLAAKGYFVYAGARKDRDLKALNKIKNVQSIRLDVTKQDEIDQAVETITKAGRGLYALVNNAGVIIVAPLIEAEESEIKFLFDVNVYGPYRITKAFAPLIIESKGRITTIGSISGILSGRFFGPYSMTKHAIEAFTDSLAAEMASFEVQVSVVEPGNYNSKILDSMIKRNKKHNLDTNHSRFEKQYKEFEQYATADRSKYKDPQEVADSVEHALFSDKPKRRYMTVPNAREAERTVKQALREMVQLNAGQTYTNDRETLIKMLDELLAEAK
jgi:NAD(P)-dependent dehydrogenase (short-subunit alcohol dehydrogenase family)